MSINIPEDLRRAIEEIVNAKLSNIKGRTETLAFVDSVIEEAKKRGFTLNDDLEAMARPYVVDVLWSLKKKGVISMDEDLLHFTVTRQET